MNEIGTLIQEVCSDSTYALSYRDYLESANLNILNKVDIISKILFNDGNYEMSDHDSGLTYITNDGHAFTMSDFQSAVHDEATNVICLDGISVAIDDIMQDIQDQQCIIDLMIESLKTVVKDEGTTTSADANLLISRFQNKFGNASGSVRSLIDKICTTISDKDKPIRSKVSDLYHMLDNSEEFSQILTYDEIEDISSSSLLSTCTGINPLKAIGLAIVEPFENINWNNIKTAVVSGINTVKKSFEKAMGWLKENFENGMCNVMNKTLEWTDTTVTDWKSLKGGDGSVDNAYMYFQDTVYEILYNHSAQQAEGWYMMGGHLYPDGNYYSNQYVLEDFINNAERNVWYVSDIPGATIMTALIGSGDNINNYWYKTVVRFKPIDRTAASCVYDIDTDIAGEMLINMSRLSAQYTPCFPDNHGFGNNFEYVTLDDYMFYSVLTGKTLAFKSCEYAWKNVLNEDYRTAENVSTLLQFMTKYILLSQSGSTYNHTYTNNTVTLASTPIYNNSTHSWSQNTTTVNDPTNVDFVKACCYYGSNGDQYCNEFGAYSAGFCRWNSSDESAKTTTKDLCNLFFMMSLIWGQHKMNPDSNNFTPYYKTTSIPKGSYHINNDKDNVNATLTRGAILVSAAILTAAAVTLGSYVSNIRFNSMQTNMIAGLKQSAITEKLAKGEAVSKQEWRDCYKATKKAVRLNKLSGGFASVTTGLSTWSDNSLSLPGLGSSSDDIMKLIAGS